jgi:hypothetical protein
MLHRVATPLQQVHEVYERDRSNRVSAAASYRGRAGVFSGVRRAHARTHAHSTLTLTAHARAHARTAHTVHRPGGSVLVLPADKLKWSRTLTHARARTHGRARADARAGTHTRARTRRRTRGHAHTGAHAPTLARTGKQRETMASVVMKAIPQVRSAPPCRTRVLTAALTKRQIRTPETRITTQVAMAMQSVYTWHIDSKLYPNGWYRP